MKELVIFLQDEEVTVFEKQEGDSGQTHEHVLSTIDSIFLALRRHLTHSARFFEGGYHDFVRAPATP